MKKHVLFTTIISIILATSIAQTYLDLEDNMEIPSDSWIVINPGNYTIPDQGNDGIIQINDKQNVIIDGSGVSADGTNYSGYTIKINNSSNIVIKNFELLSHYFYAVYITNSNHIIINNNNFNYNKVDSSGWISIWTDYQQALGGGILMYQTQFAQVFDNNMKFQNDGVALYHCDSIVILNNDFAWNTSFGIRMYFTGDSDIQNNIANHVNRPYTNPSDCAGILLITSNNNYVAYNNFSHSGDGIFLGQFQYSQILNNNYFAYNECSYSPHNAIEATFADGNIYEYNNCNYSHYGLWLGYSFNSIVRNNEIIGNQYSGIAIDRGFNNQITENNIKDNPIGIELWEGGVIPPYQNQFSHDYFITNNNIEGNTIAISLKETEHSIVMNNEFLNNRNGIFIEANSAEDTISQNTFRNTAFYHIENNSTGDIYAINNSFVINDEAIINCKIIDQEENPNFGEVIWQPYLSGIDPQFQDNIPNDMAEPLADWNAYPEACWGYGLSEPTSVEWDYNEKLFGDASVHMSTGNGWDIGTMYRPEGDSIASWCLYEQDTLVFWIKSINNTGYGFQFCNVIIGNHCGGYYKYTASAISILNPSIGQWHEIRIPLAGVSPWSRTTFGTISFDDINFVEIHADTWEYGFELWFDGVTFKGISTILNKVIAKQKNYLFQNYPNPVVDLSRINFYLVEKSPVNINLTDLDGKTTFLVVDTVFEKGMHFIEINASDLANGIYLYQFSTNNFTDTKKLIISK